MSVRAYMSSVGAMSITHSRRTRAGLVQRQPVRHTAAPVVSAQGEPVDAQRGPITSHEVLCQCAFAVVAVVRQARRV
jgi:hypothetical protein